MTGPGGDYVTRFDIKGNSLVKSRTRQSAGHDSDAESAGGGSAWGFLARRRKKKQQPDNASVKRPADRFERTHPPAAKPATYARSAAQQPQQQLAMLEAIETWLDNQSREIGRLVADQDVFDAMRAAPTQGGASATEPGTAAAVRVIRFNRTTTELPTPAPALDAAEQTPGNTDQHEDTATERVPEPCHAFASEAAAQDELNQDNTTPTPRSVNDDQPQPHAQADENFDINSRHPAVARLFADDERARRSARRLQGHHLRTRRSTHQKGLPDQGCEQGALFGAVA
jgi:hypothetical protein